MTQKPPCSQPPDLGNTINCVRVKTGPDSVPLIPILPGSRSAVIITAVWLILFLLSPGFTPSAFPRPGQPDRLGTQWRRLAGSKIGKMVFARPPYMYILNLPAATEKIVPGVIIEGGPGRKNRGKTPRPSWAPDGRFFSYRFSGHIFVSDESGQKKEIAHPLMDVSDETRWTWSRRKDGDWLVGPSIRRHVILVSITEPRRLQILYNGGDVIKHCELTGGDYVIYDNGETIFSTPAFSHKKGIPLSHGQSCRPCASPDNRAAWLPFPHDRYIIHDAASGSQLSILAAPPGEEIYRLNWSNLPDFAVHMFGSEDNNRIFIRQTVSGASIYTGCGWDPDLWVSPADEP